MRYLLDTNLLCKETHLRARNWIVQHQLQIAISSMTIAEIAQGIEALRVDESERNGRLS